ncbi:MAG: PEGA domain-containing protein [Nannocystaceae bacterium]
MWLATRLCAAWLASQPAAAPTRASEPSPDPSSEPSPDALPEVEPDPARASAAWERGAAAFAAGRLDEAIEQFELTYRYSGRPGPLFSLGQAHRHLWENTGDARHRRIALQRYRQYLLADPDGRRKLEAQRWIGMLEELEGPDEVERVFTRLAITAATPHATARIDGGAPLQLPLTPDVAPGRHVVEVVAPGFQPQRREVDLPEGSTLPLVFELEPRDAHVALSGPAGAEVWVDGERLGPLPTRAALSLPPGLHQIGVAQRGRTLFVRELELAAEQRLRLDAQLERTGQRKVALAAVSVGAIAEATALGLMGAALQRQHRARTLQRQLEQAAHGVPREHVIARDQAIAQRDALRTAAIATGVTGAVVLTTGLLLWFSDRPPVASQLRRPARRAASARLRMTPLLAPTILGAGIGGRL